eukprot:6203593-Pleurochrysis_carterae.AAC.2
MRVTWNNGQLPAWTAGRANPRRCGRSIFTSMKSSTFTLMLPEKRAGHSCSVTAVASQYQIRSAVMDSSRSQS